MYDVVLLSDIYTSPYTETSGQKWSFWSRYLGPYTVKQTILNNCANVTVRVVDYFTKIPDFFDFMSTIIGPETKYIGISTTFLHNRANNRINDFNLWFTNHEDITDWFCKLKELAPNAKIFLGGHMCDVWFQFYVKRSPKSPLPHAMQYVDCVIHGYGEKAVPNYINGTVDPKHIYYRDSTMFISDGINAGSPLSECLRINWQENDHVQQGEWLPLELSKGCRFGCKFCMFDRFGTTIKSKEALIKELTANFKNFGTCGYHFTDDTINDSLEKVKLIHEVMTSLPFKVEWIAYARPDMFYRYPEMLSLMREAGCRGMFLGIETFNANAAKIAGKGLHPAKIKNILTWIKQQVGDDIFVLASFIIGLVGETEESLEETLSYLKEQTVIDKITFEVLYVRPPDFRTGVQKDFNNNSDLYGFKRLEYNPYYWEHDTLNFNQCTAIAKRWKNELQMAKYSGFDQAIEGFTNFWSYPRMRSLGYTHQEAFTILKDANIPDRMYTLNNQWIESYHRSLELQHA